MQLADDIMALDYSNISELREFPRFTKSLQAFTCLKGSKSNCKNGDDDEVDYAEIIKRARDQYRRNNFFE